MARENKPSIYSDRGTIGSSDELDEYGVWVKSEPHDLSGFPAEIPDLEIPDAENLPDLDIPGDFENSGDFDIPEMEDTDLSPNMEELDIESADPLESVDPFESANFSEPEDFSELVDADDPLEPGDPFESADLSEPVDFDDPADLSESEDFSELVDADDPLEPGDPFESAGFDEPEDLSEPASLSDLEELDSFEPLPLDDEPDFTLKGPEDSAEGLGFTEGAIDDLTGSSGPLDLGDISESPDLDEPEPKDPPKSAASPGSAPPDLSTQLLMRIAEELSSIRVELSDLKKDFASHKDEKTRPEAGRDHGFFNEEEDEKIALTGAELINILNAEGAGETEAAESPAQGFFDEDDDEKIALTGDELDNILNTANFTEEVGTDATGQENGEADFFNEEPASNGIEDSDSAEDSQAAPAADETMDTDFNEDFSETLDGEEGDTLTGDLDIDFGGDLPETLDAEAGDAVIGDLDIDFGEDEPEEITVNDLDIDFGESFGEGPEENSQTAPAADRIADSDFDEDLLEEESPDTVITGGLDIDFGESLTEGTGQDEGEEISLGDFEAPREIAGGFSEDESIDFSPEEAEEVLEEEPGIEFIDLDESLLSEEPESLAESVELPDFDAEAGSELLQIREEGAFPMTSAPEDTSYLEEDIEAEEDYDVPEELSGDEPLDDDITLIDEIPLDLSEAVIDEPDLSMAIQDNPIEEPSLENISLDLDLDEDIGETLTDSEDELDISLEEEEEIPVSSETTAFDDEPETLAEELPDVEDDLALIPEAFAEEDGETAAEVIELEPEEIEPALPEELPFIENDETPETLDTIDDSSGEKQAASVDIPPGLHEELKTVLNYMDKLLESLPDDKIEEFARSEYFDTYKKLFKDLGLV